MLTPAELAAHLRASETTQDVRDVIEWHLATMRAAAIRARKP